MEGGAEPGPDGCRGQLSQALPLAMWMADGHVQAAGLLVDGVEVGVRQKPVALHRAQQHRAGAVLLGETDLVQRVRHAQGRRHARPPEPPVRLRPDVRQPPVPAPAQRHLHRRPLGHLFDEHGVVQHLHVHADVVHVLQPEPHVAQLPGLLGLGELAAHLLLAPRQLLLGEGGKAESPHLAVHQPELERGAVLFRRRQRHRTELTLRGFEIVPGAVAFHYVGVRIHDQGVSVGLSTHGVLLFIGRIRSPVPGGAVAQARAGLKPARTVLGGSREPVFLVGLRPLPSTATRRKSRCLCRRR